ncbi:MULTISPECIES: HRDC domain-containing protein [unclassified Nocardioides]|uniref:HRDC domain-containing protein n=1 Tax=unclassified Nocardioides TaxID=2615069 RepID=UPI0007037FCB|nr:MULTISPECIES: HRDC domain-containing protein [unclassified Nocardioides]KQZ67207.1 3'-5' exonuclease [Nocardioides sp. Root151]KRF12714.1 3'-5' exonuclease [Nocardioides sp. Soil796]
MSDPGDTPDEASAEAAPEGTTDAAPEPEPAPLLTLRDGLPPVIDTDAGLADVVARFAAGTGPVAIDAERASGYRYSARAYLIQLRREGSGTALVDPIAFDNLDDLQVALEGVEWILHAATQDLACLAEVGLRPSSLFDTELAGRLLGYPRVGLATLVETTLGMHLRKEHSAADWSRRPLPESWLEYAALDVEPLIELRAVMASELDESGKAGWAREEFDHLLDFTPAVRAEPWRRTSQLHRVRGRRALAAVRALWETRNRIAEQRDVTPGRILPDSAIIAAALALPVDKAALLGTSGFHGRGADRYSSQWVAALAEARGLSESELPQRGPRGDGPPVPRTWIDKDPVAARRLTAARAGMATLAETNNLPVENLLTPDTLRRVLWTPPGTREPAALAQAVQEQLAGHGARPWQIGLVEPVLTAAILAADEEPEDADTPTDAPSSDG